MHASIRNLLDHRALLLIGLIVALLARGASNDSWTDDVWEHAAVVRALIASPGAPAHPQLDLTAPHPGFTPYTLAVAALAAATGLDARAALGAVGIANIALLLAGIAFLARRFAGPDDEPRAAPGSDGASVLPAGAADDARSLASATAFYSLLFTLLLWGGGVWGYSGFFHLRGLATVAPYPSTFAGGLAVIALALVLDELRRGGPARGLAIAALTALVLVCHPLTAIFLGTAAAACLLATQGAPGPRRAAVALALLAGGAVALAWPYWSLTALIATESAGYDDSNAVLYGPRLTSVLPALAGVVALALRLRRDPRDPLTWTTVALALVFGAGALLGRHAYGRVLSYAVLMLHVALAALVARLEVRAGGAGRRAAVSLAVVALLAAFAWSAQLQPFARAVQAGATRGVGLDFLAEHVGPRDVVLADLGTAWPVPAHAGVVVAVASPMPFVDDAEARRDDVRLFFARGTPADVRAAILSRHDARFVLLDLTHPQSDEIRDALGTRARQVHLDTRWQLLRLDD